MPVVTATFALNASVRLGALAVGLSLALPAALAAEPVPAATAEDGRAILAANCASCHAIGQTGESPLAKAPPFRSLKKRYPVAALAEALAEGIVTGHPGMPQFTFEPRQIDAILAYLETLEDR